MVGADHMGVVVSESVRSADVEASTTPQIRIGLRRSQDGRRSRRGWSLGVGRAASGSASAWGSGVRVPAGVECRWCGVGVLVPATGWSGKLDVGTVDSQLTCDIHAVDDRGLRSRHDRLVGVVVGGRGVASNSV